MIKLPDSIVPLNKDGRIYDFSCNTGYPLITSYYRLNRSVVFTEDDSYVELGDDKERVEITSIDALRSTFEELISTSKMLLQKYTPMVITDRYTHPDFSGLENNLLVEQLIFDVLFDKYIKESKLMTRNGYSTYIAEKLYDSKIPIIDYSKAINEQLTRGMQTFHNRNESLLQEQFKMLGVDSNKYLKYYTPRIKENSNPRKPKVVWDQLYFNFCLPLTSRQYRRTLTRENRNYSYEEFLEDLISYNSFVVKLLPNENESCKKYFRMSMDYYVLESYKRIDFMLKLIEVFAPDEINHMDRHHFLLKRFTPNVLVPCIPDGELNFFFQAKYYRPLLIIEDKLLKMAGSDKTPSYRYYESLLERYRYVHAKTYELFKYHYTFVSSNYVDIKRFLEQSYSMVTYHQSNTVWSFIQDNKWNQLDATAKRPIKEMTKSLFALNRTLFWDLPDTAKPQNKSQ